MNLRFAALTLVLATVSGCSLDSLIYSAALPSTSTSARVEWIADRAAYIDVRVTTAGRELRFLLPGVGEAAETCAAYRSDAPVDSTRYVNSGPLGELDRGGARCDPVGILSLQEWRSRRPRGSREPIPRSRAKWSIDYRDADLLLLRGRFGLAGELGWVAGADSIAVVERNALCDAVAELGEASLEFRHVGPDVLALLGEDGRCRLLGLARPLF